MIKVIKESDTWLVINKPSGTSVHNDSESVIEFFKEQNLEIAPVHRIDKDTSGLLLLSKDQSATAELQQALQHSKKYYLAICRGQTKEESGTWTDKLSEKAEGSKNPRGKKSDLKECITNWKRIYSNKYFTLMLFNIETGRTHQIRRHCAIHKLEILGDKRYGDSKYQNLIKNKYNFSQMALHSYKLDIQLEKIQHNFIADIPTYFKELIGESLEKYI
ncbi:RNA pseudouridine synthase [Halobacteriovorax sp. JY17]|uniref:RluA family pseudouridine synthase n=1 Tax=Halobacteriovorax sp. JY17 TaxID=2014617 RepID=UPI0025BCB42D|nr:RNA pseudouridine synthase [Halobacteriovorax sp. JY17]